MIHLYGQEVGQLRELPYGCTPGFGEGEAVTWRVNGQEVTEPELTWMDDREVRQVRLKADMAGGRALYLPVIVG